MKKYVILTPSIGDMGGAQMYVANKVKYLERKGWSVFVFYFRSYTNILIPALQQYIQNKIIDMQYGCQFIPKFKLRHDLSFISSKIHYSSDDNVIIESQLVSLVGWGELLAEYFQGKHVINYLEEKIDFSASPLSDFMEFKLKRYEVLNSSEERLRCGFGVSFKEEYLNYTHIQRFFCSNVIDFSKDQPLEIEKADINILSIGRLDKPYIPKLLSEVKSFANKHPESKINFMLVGGSNAGEEEKSIMQSFISQENVNLIMFGYLFPVPINIVKSADVGISSSNSILVTADQGIPTICIDMYDYDSIGIYGYTTTNKFHESRADKQSLSEALESVVFGNLIDVVINNNSSDQDGENQFDDDFAYLNNSTGPEEYFNIRDRYSPFALFGFSMKWLLHEIAGYKQYKRG